MPITLSTHVLDATAGRPAAGVKIVLERRTDDGTWAQTMSASTDDDGRLRLPGTVDPGCYRITFASGDYFAGRGVPTFYPEVTVTFQVTSENQHCHVPLLLSPFAYSTYRGS
ncbi:MAG TPA: hydroxyisourate hydrolase [Streptosporangiaceae bacterium]|jgi:5-hydroxyisourate hydrolase